jgi:hypothetical protein
MLPKLDGCQLGVALDETDLRGERPLSHSRARLVLNGLHRFDHRAAVYVRALPTDPKGRSV